MSEKLKLEILLAAVDRVTRPLKAITAGSNETARALKAAKDQLKELNAANDRIDAFRKVSKDAAITANQLKAAQQRLRETKQAMSETLTPSRELKKAFADARQEVSLYGMRLSTLIDKKKRLRGELEAAGVPLKDLKRHQGDLAKQIDTATAAVTRQTAAMKAQNEVARRMHAARAAYDKTMATRNRIAGAGVSTMAAGAAMGLPVLAAVRQFASFEDAMLGVARQMEGARDANGQLTASYYEMADSIKAMSERLPGTANDIAAIVEAGARMGIQGKENLLTFAELTSVMANAFDLPVDQIGMNIGKLSQLYKIPIKDIGQLGDAINFLDDNALSNGGDIIDVMQRMAGAATMVNMNFKEAAALGSTFLSLGSKADVAASASNAMIRELSIATMQTKRFKGGLDMLKLDAKALQLGMSKDATGTILKVLEAIKALPQEKQLEAATRMFGKEFGDDAAKLAQNLGMYREQLKLVNDEQARGSMQREADARAQNLSSVWENSKDVLANLASDLGGKLKPALVDILGAASGVLTAVRDWVKENPGLAGGIMKVTGILAVLLTTFGALGIGLAGVMGTMAIARYGFFMAGGAIKTFGVALKVLAMNPFVLTIVGIALAALLIYKYWEPIKAFFSSVWEGAKANFNKFIDAFRQFDWSSIGGFIVRGIETGLDAMTAGLYTKLKALAGGLVTTVKSALGIKSPSRVFAEIGGFTMEGLEQGLLGGQGGPLGAVRDMARRMAAAGAGVMIGGAAMAGELPRIDSRPPISIRAGISGGGQGGPLVGTLIIQAAPGMDEAALARLVEQKLMQIEAGRAARGRSRLRDSE